MNVVDQLIQIGDLGPESRREIEYQLACAMTAQDVLSRKAIGWGQFFPWMRDAISKTQGHACYLCNEPMSDEGHPDKVPTIHRVVPLALGGKDVPSNLRAVCFACSQASNRHANLLISRLPKKPSAQTLRLYFDGEAKPNTGQGKNRACVALVTKERVAIKDVPTGRGESNSAEWKALLVAMEVLIERRAQNAEVIGDCLPIIDCANGNIRTPQKWAEFKRRYDNLAARIPTIKLRFVTRDKNIAGRYLQSGDGGHFRMGLLMFEDAEEAQVEPMVALKEVA